MIRKVKSDKASWLISKILNDDTILEQSPIIAGGCALSVYRALKLHDTEHKWAELKRGIDRGVKNIKIDSFGDIDIWFQEGSEIHDHNHHLNWMVSGNTKYDMDISNYKSSLVNIFKISGWANSFRQKSTAGYRVVQFIKKSPKSVPDLLDTFDFTNCSVAWHDGFLYYDEDVDRSFENFELVLKNSNPYLSDNISMRVFNALRAFKYSKRYSLDFCSNLTSHIFNLYVDIPSINYDNYKDGIVEIESLYGKKISSVDILRGMVEQLKSDFKSFLKMKHFKKEHAIYLIDQSDYLDGIKSIINKDVGDKNNLTF
tara:strand:- start:272 stop:1213 length:942 start_codon:yes stop_codon:yes gene_type:complete